MFANSFVSGQPPTLEGTVGSDLVLLCAHSNSNPAPTITWMKDGSSLPMSSRFTFEQVTMEGPSGEMQVGSRLTISSVEASDAGAYHCVATNSLFPGMTVTGPTTTVTVSSE